MKHMLLFPKDLSHDIIDDVSNSEYCDELLDSDAIDAWEHGFLLGVAAAEEYEDLEDEEE